MPRALDCSAYNFPLTERGAVVRANCAKSMNPLIDLHQQYRLFVDQHSLELTLSKVVRYQNRREVCRAAPVGVAVDHDSHVKNHHAAQIAASHYEQISCKRDRKCCPARLPVLVPADQERTEEEYRCSDIHNGMESTDGFLRRINTHPVRQPRCSCTQRSCHANQDGNAGSKAKLG